MKEDDEASWQSLSPHLSMIGRAEDRMVFIDWS